MCKKKNITLLQFTEIEVFEKPDFVWSLIDDYLYGINHIDITEIREITEEEGKEFLDENFTFYDLYDDSKFYAAFVDDEIHQVVVVKNEHVYFNCKKLYSKEDFFLSINRIYKFKGYVQNNKYPIPYKLKEEKQLKPKVEWWSHQLMTRWSQEPVGLNVRFYSMWNSGYTLFSL